jgi:hypothetical protein
MKFLIRYFGKGVGGCDGLGLSKSYNASAILGNRCQRNDRAKHTILLLLTETAAHANAQETKIRKLRVYGYFAITPPPNLYVLRLRIFYRTLSRDFFSDETVHTYVAIVV